MSEKAEFKAQKYDNNSLEERGRGRANWFRSLLDLQAEDLRGASVLEVGSGFGEFSAAMEDVYGAHPIGVDPWPRNEKGPYADRNFHRQYDITDDAILELGSFDFAGSFDCLEHVENPRQALVNIHALLKPGGRAFLKYNLHRGANASHIVHFTQMPWCHLLLSDKEMEELAFEKSGQRRKPAWVNRATYAHYLIWLEEIGFEVDRVWYVDFPMEEEFYQAHKDKLCVYPREDLDKDFMCVILKKAA